ncbi:FAD-dependent oxidoreductase [Demequina rhizosphaerae]|uniref:FAD-dependent oxidoreductase n=1 Tax=Demequina rhizosphaerae TaxID=1638985 RepID=UPI000784A575|nr:FAD-dependent oxidoreductase [Demequina rhizosphaerae]
MADDMQNEQRGNGARVAIIGGGYTGLVAALRLTEAGYHVTVFEAGAELGGLAGGFEIEGAPLERAYHHIFRTDTAIIDLVHELGLSEKLRWHRGGQSLYFDGTLHPFSGALDLLRFGPLALHDRIRAGVVALYLQWTRRWHRFEAVTALQWMRKAAGANVTRVIWEPLLRGKFHRHHASVSMAWLWARVHTRANSKAPGEMHERLGYFDGGFAVLTDALEQRLRDAGADIRTDARIVALSADESGTRIVLDRSEEHFAVCVATIPSGVFGRLCAQSDLPAPYRERLASIQYLGARIVVFSSGQRLGRTYWTNVNDASMPFLVFIAHTELVGTARYAGHHIYYLATYLPADDEQFTCDADQLEDSWFDALATMIPEFDRGAIREKHHFRFSNAQHVVDTSYRSRIPERATPLPHVFLSNFSQIYPEDRGTNFAVREGERIARSAIDHLAAQRGPRPQ